MKWRLFALSGMALLLAAPGVRAADCPGHPDALGTSRVMTIDPQDYTRIGTIQYPHSLPLADKEVVLTFDDGPLPPYSNRVLEVLAEQCVRANYFIVGEMAHAFPATLRKIQAAGHVIGTHSQTHPLSFNHMSLDSIKREVEQGIASAAVALGDRNEVAPFFRIPGLLRSEQVEHYLHSRSLAAWSADVVADDWKHIKATEIVRRAMKRLNEKGRGILLLHDIHPATALALPQLLRELKQHGYRIVLVVPGQGGTPVASAEPPEQGVPLPPVRPLALAAAESSIALPPLSPVRTAAAAAPELAIAAPPVMLATASFAMPLPLSLRGSLPAAMPEPAEPPMPELKPSIGVTIPSKLSVVEPTADLR
jgi:peptidoglycan/xylan/chitin deacetylase (PgdA/CDA1 family)